MSRKKRVIGLSMAALLLLALIALPVTGVVKVVKITSATMSPTVQAGDTIVVTKLFNPATAKKGDVVVYDGTSAGLKTLRELYLTRVVATAGDTVDLVNGELCVNGVPLPERNGHRPRGSVATIPGYAPPLYPVTVRTGSVFTVDDNHGTSLDGRYTGPIPVSSLVYSAKRILKPGEHAGEIK